MQTIAVWEDEEINRKVSLAVDYEVGPAGITIQGVTPQQVEFPGQQRTIRVWTDAGRRILAEQFANSPGRDAVIANLEDELLTTAK